MPYQPYNPERQQYSQILYPWAIVRQLPQLQNAIVGRFRSQSDAEGHLRCLRRLVPTARFVVFFDLPSAAIVPEFPHCKIDLHERAIGDRPRVSSSEKSAV